MARLEELLDNIPGMRVKCTIELNWLLNKVTDKVAI
jgi:hypothetical protein